jgi:hypothetical protein
MILLNGIEIKHRSMSQNNILWRDSRVFNLKKKIQQSKLKEQKQMQQTLNYIISCIAQQ